MIVIDRIGAEEDERWRDDWLWLTASVVARN